MIAVALGDHGIQERWFGFSIVSYMGELHLWECAADIPTDEWEVAEHFFSVARLYNAYSEYRMLSTFKLSTFTRFRIRPIFNGFFRLEKLSTFQYLAKKLTCLTLGIHCKGIDQA